MENGFALVASAASAEAVDNLVDGQLIIHHCTERHLLGFEQVFQRLGLGESAGKSVEDEAATDEAAAALTHHFPDGGIGYEFTVTHELKRSFHRRGLIAIESFAGGAKDVPGRKMAGSKTFGEKLSLRAFADAGRSEQNEAPRSGVVDRNRGALYRAIGRGPLQPGCAIVLWLRHAQDLRHAEGFAVTVITAAGAATPLCFAPNFADDALEVCAEHFFDDGIGLAALRELEGDDLHVVGAVEIGYVGITVFAGGSDAELFASGDVFVECGFLFGSENSLLDGSVGPNADMIGAADVDGVHDMIENVLAGGDGRRGDDLGHEIDAKVAAAIGQRFENFVRDDRRVTKLCEGAHGRIIEVDDFDEF